MWRKQATISVQEEFAGKALPPDLEDSLPKELDDLFDRIRSGVRRSAELYIHLCSTMERLTKRNEGMAAESLRFSRALVELTEATADTYAVDTNDVPLLNEGLGATARRLAAAHGLLEDEARAWDSGVLEDVKRQRDCLVSMRDLFDRKDRLARDNIAVLERRIQSNEQKLAGLHGRSDRAQREAEEAKVEEAIVRVSGRRGARGSALLTRRRPGQAVDRGPARARRLHQGVCARRVRRVPAQPVRRVAAAPGLEPGARQIRRAAGGQLARARRRRGEHARRRVAQGDGEGRAGDCKLAWH